MKTVKKITTVLGTLIMAIMLTGCPLNSTVEPENLKKIKVNEELIGTWKESLKAEDSTEIIIKKFDDYNYSISARIKYLGSKFTTMSFKGKVIKIKKKNILLLLNEQDKLYYFADFFLYYGNKLSLDVISGESMEPINNSKELLNFLNFAYETDNIKHESLFYDDLIKINN